jgi:beta-phosphoglucomutase
MMGITAVIFDFNGVLVDDEAVHFALFREVLDEEGVVITERDYHERYLGLDDRGCFQAALMDVGEIASRDRLDSLVVRKAQRYVTVAEQGLRYFPGAALALERISARWPVAICSGALRSEIQYGLQRLNRLEHVSVIVSADDTIKCKPDPEGYQLALAGLCALGGRTGSPIDEGKKKSAPQLAPDDCLVVEDSLAGIQSARGAGMRTVGVPNTYCADELLRAGADAVIAGLPALTPAWIERYFAL